MSPFEIAQMNLTSPPVMAFGAGAVAVLARRNLRLPTALYTVLSGWLLASIGIKGGVALSHTPLAAIALPAAATILLGTAIPVGVYALLRRRSRFGVADAAAMAAHYGSVSAVTFTAAIAFLDATATPYEAFMPSLLVMLEVPAILVALTIARMRSGSSAGWGHAVREVVTGRGIVLLAGGLVAGIAVGASGVAKVPSWFTAAFLIALTLFLLDMGMSAASRLRDFRVAGGYLTVFALAAPVVHGLAGVTLGTLVGMSAGGAAVLGIMAASASYIAAPAAVRIALPEANPGYYLTTSIGITFPFNLVVGIPLMISVARWMA
ncbi:MAG TPA: sodium-dependent bicarbonate transport family permease, partial [Actinomycetota bacterium]|nr:sodium-dependent bicarbonate transport family permease [Actinomycetota bacterium]